MVELFEARKPRDPAVISEIDGMVKDGGVVKGQRKLIIVPDDTTEPREYALPRGVHVNVQEGERVCAGEGGDRLAPGSPDVLEMSPGSDVIPVEDRRVVETYAGGGALDVEELFGASVGWMANAVGGGHAFAKLSDHFFGLISDGSMRAATVQRELRASGDPGLLIADVLSELSPLTKEEPPILGALVGALWLGLRLERGGESELEKLSDEWRAMLSRDSSTPQRSSIVRRHGAFSPTTDGSRQPCLDSPHRVFGPPAHQFSRPPLSSWAMEGGRSDWRSISTTRTSKR